MDEIYELESALQARDLRVFQLERELAAARAQNDALKSQIEAIAIENCGLMPKKRRTSPEALARWAYYHTNKTRVAAERGLDDWREVKRVCDQLFAQIK